MIRNNSTTSTNYFILDAPHKFHEPLPENVLRNGKNGNASDAFDVYVSNQLIPYDNPSPCATENGHLDQDATHGCGQRAFSGIQAGNSSAWYDSVTCSSPYRPSLEEASFTRSHNGSYSVLDSPSDSYLVRVQDTKQLESVKTLKVEEGDDIYVIESTDRNNGLITLSRSVSAPYAQNLTPTEDDDTAHNARQHKTSMGKRNDILNHQISVANSLDSSDEMMKYEVDSDFSETGSEQYFDTQAPAAVNHNHKGNDLSDGSQGLGRSSSASSVLTPPGSGVEKRSARVKRVSRDVKVTEDDADLNFSDQQDVVDKGAKAGKYGKQARGAQNLPPCRVCGNKASGLHFGVNTCEACNEFFRRSLKRGASYYCTKNRECQVYGKKRNACSYCRYQRCVDMGMSRDAIKTGRYSHKTRTEYAMEVEEFRQKEMSKAEKEKFEELLRDLVLFHDKYVKNTTRVPSEELVRSQAAYLELYNSQREMELRHPPLTSPAMSKKLLNDLSPVSEDLSLTLHDVEMTEKWLRNYINYAKNVPGFKDLALPDQASLVRGTWFEFWFLGAYRGYNSKLRVVHYPNGRTFHEEEIVKVFGEEYTDFSFSLADRMASLQVTPEEMVLIKTVCLTFPDRTPLHNRDAVEKMHWLMVSCLLHILEKNRPGDTKIFPLIVSKLVELRTLTEIAMRAHKNTIYQDVLKDSPLLSEMVDTKTIYVNADTQGKTVSRMPISPAPL